MKFGARILKTGIAIVLALYLSELLNLPAPVLSGILCNFCNTADHLSFLSNGIGTSTRKYNRGVGSCFLRIDIRK